MTRKILAIASLCAILTMAPGGALRADTTPRAPATNGWFCPPMGRWAGPNPPAAGDWFCPGYSRRAMFPGQVGGCWGPHHGSRWQGAGRCPYHSGWNQQPMKPVDHQQATAILENYLNSLGNPRLKLGSVEDKGEVFQGKILTLDGSLVDTVQVAKRTGWIRLVR